MAQRNYVTKRSLGLVEMFLGIAAKRTWPDPVTGEIRSISNATDRSLNVSYEQDLPRLSSTFELDFSPGGYTRPVYRIAEITTQRSLSPRMTLGWDYKPSPDLDILLQAIDFIPYHGELEEDDYAAPGNKDDGLLNLKIHVDALPRDKLVVIYCGCCPWEKCPNTAAAYSQMTAMGFTKVKVLYLANNFGADWVDKGYPVTRGG